MIVLESLTLGVPGGMAGIGVGAPTAPRLGEILARLLELTCGLELTAGPMDWVQAAATVAGAGVFCAVSGLAPARTPAKWRRLPELEVVPADRASKRRAFLDFPYRLYARDSLWVPPLRGDQKKILDNRRHPFYRHAESQLFLAVRGSKVAGRICALLDHNAPPEAGHRIGAFGFFESMDDQEATSGLLNATREWLRKRGVHLMRGPVNPSFNYGAGVLVEGFDDPPTVGNSYNPTYYDLLLTGAGLRKARDFLAFSLKPEQLRAAKAIAGSFASVPPRARLRPFDGRQLEREAKWIWELHSKGFTSNYDFAPMSLEEVRYMACDIQRFADERLMQFCEVDNRPAGVLVAFPDWNQTLCSVRGRLFPLGWWRLLRGRRHITRLRIWLLIIAPEWQGTGLAALFLSLVGQPGTEQYKEIEASWIVESHPTMVSALSLLNARVSKRYRLYEAALD